MKYWLWLSKIDANIAIKLLEKYKEPEIIWKLDKIDLLKMGLSEEIACEIIKQKNDDFDSYIKYIIKNNIEIITIKDKTYPIKLACIYDMPIVLYVKGNKENLYSKSVAIIGTRNCSIYGKNIAEKFSKELSKNGITIISGMARGIDTFAHIGSLKENGKTVAVLGSGLNYIYPKENEKLAEEIVKKGGTIISEFCIGIRPFAKNFPKRNRIISGLSNGILVVEAKEKSGSFITVDFGLEQGKEIYAIPGNITSINSKGTNEIIKQGAKLVTCSEEIIEDIIN